MKHVRKVRQEVFPLRTEIESDVVAFNKVLKNAVKFMPLYELLCNCHPLYRSEYARKLYKEGHFTEEQARKFVGRVTTGAL